MEEALTVTVRKPSAAAAAPASTPPRFATEAFVDTHVHLYPAYDPGTFFDAAVRNVRRAAEGVSMGEAGAVVVLCLTERPTERAFAELRDTGVTGGGGAGRWRFEDNGEGMTLLGVREGGPGDGAAAAARVAVIAGRQVVTSERLEVLALGLDGDVEPGLSLEETVLRVQGRGALAVLPYGFGKWHGVRRDAVARLIDRQPTGTQALMLGDNAGRPGFGPRPTLFDMAAAKRMTLLPGSDPLPITMAQRHACTYGVILPGPFDRARVGRQVLDGLRDVGPVPRRFGERHGLVSFVRQQVALRFAK